MATGILSTSEDWMKSGSILFQTVLEFNSKENKRGYLTITTIQELGMVVKQEKNYLLKSLFALNLNV